ncbi:hypothetical protein P692DRAFT_20881023 [Suillus brevipes Sb2]|nr:hypothetical protein P692DRAFT_20881023 [Suillus brevipes Sb2]
MSNLLNRVNILFATVDAAVVQMWANTNVSVSTPQSASIVMVAPEKCGQHPWLLLKFGDIVHVRSLDAGFADHTFSQSNTPEANLNVVSIQIKEAIFHIYLPTPAVFWCFMHIATASYYDPKRGLGLTKEMLEDAWKDFIVPGNFGFQCLRQIL